MQDIRKSFALRLYSHHNYARCRISHSSRRGINGYDANAGPLRIAGYQCTA